MKQINDFLTDPMFVQWVNNPNEELDSYWKNWIESNPGNLSNLKLAREFLTRVKYVAQEPTDNVRQRILENILKSKADSKKDVQKNVLSPSDKKPGLYLNQFQRIAAILLVGFCLIWFISSLKDLGSLENIADQMTMVQKSTLPGEKLKLILPDGSRVWLNSSSNLEYPESFESDERKVILSGEGFFEVEKDSLRPFIVESNGLITTALGTSFNIDTKTNNEIYVSLLTGKVKINSPNYIEDVFLNPGEELKHTSNNSNPHIERFNLEEVIAWREGVLIFKNASLSEVLKSLEDWYGVKIEVENETGIDWGYSGEYKNQTLENVLSTLSYVQEFEYQINKKSVTIKF